MLAHIDVVGVYVVQVRLSRQGRHDDSRGVVRGDATVTVLGAVLGTGTFVTRLGQTSREMLEITEFVVTTAGVMYCTQCP